MSKFSQFIQEEHHKPTDTPNKSIDENNIQEMLDYYSQMSSDQLMTEFLKASKKKRAEGGLDENECQRLTDALSPYLNEAQKETMSKLLETGKNV